MTDEALDEILKRLDGMSAADLAPVNVAEVRSLCAEIYKQKLKVAIRPEPDTLALARAGIV